jgi:protein transport protein SEC23
MYKTTTSLLFFLLSKLFILFYFKRYMINRENTLNCLTMIQPTLDEYSFNGPPRPVLLASSSLSEDKIFLLDSFFQIVIFTGTQMAYWRSKGYQDDPNYASFKQLIEAPKTDAKVCFWFDLSPQTRLQSINQSLFYSLFQKLLMKDRFPLPRFIECDQGGSQARFVYAALNPGNNPAARSGDAPFSTEDVSFETFMEHLKKLVVSS